MKDSCPKISIVVPSYNREGEIEACLRSVLDQSFEDWELIVADNSSTDNTVKVIKDTIAKDPRCCLIENSSNLGPTLNWLVGVKRAKSHWVKILFSDDRLLPEALQAFSDATKDADLESFVLDGAIKWPSDKISSHEFLWHNIVSHRLYLVSPTLALMPKQTLIDAFSMGFSATMTDFGKKTGAGYDLLSFLLCCTRGQQHILLDNTYTKFGRPKSSITLTMNSNTKTKVSLMRQYFSTQMWFARNCNLSSGSCVKNAIFRLLLYVAASVYWLRAGWVATRQTK